MPEAKPDSSMEQEIFRLGLPVETVSAYLLVCGLAADAAPITRSRLLQVWNGAPDALDAALAELGRHAILVAVGDGDPTYRPQPADRWRPC